MGDKNTGGMMLCSQNINCGTGTMRYCSIFFHFNLFSFHRLMVRFVFWEIIRTGVTRCALQDWMNQPNPELPDDGQTCTKNLRGRAWKGHFSSRHTIQCISPSTSPDPFQNLHTKRSPTYMFVLC